MHDTADGGAHPARRPARRPAWRHLSSAAGDLPAPANGDQQTACVVFDIDGDGVDEIVVAERTEAPAITWLRRRGDGWQRGVIEADRQRPEAGGCAFDVDGDGDLDLIIGGDAGSDELWWYENPAPHFDPDLPWKRHLIKRGGGRAHHDQVVADFLGAGRAQLAFWNQGAHKLFLAPVPRDPRRVEGWDLIEIFDDAHLAAGLKQEGMCAFDLDGDGRLDLITKPYTWEAPRLDLWLNQGPRSGLRSACDPHPST